jgi:beta-glucosidase/6-phospho-beta-glucosidase/beta-galactosidase
MQFQLGWMADPLYFGDYPAVMRASQPHLPKFKDAEKKLLVGSLDFFALNYYTSHFVAAAPTGAPKAQVLLSELVIRTLSDCKHMHLLVNIPGLEALGPTAWCILHLGSTACAVASHHDARVELRIRFGTASTM